MQFLRTLLGLTRLDDQKKTIREKLKAEHTVHKIHSYQKNWLQHVRTMEHPTTHFLPILLTSLHAL
jgi:hypothetical protein